MMKKLDLFFILMFSILLIGIGAISCAKKSGTGPINKISFNFEIEGSGVLELSITNSRGVSLYNYTVENAVEKVEIEEAVIKGNTLVAKANAGKGYIFDAWDGVSEVTNGDAVIVPESLADATIKVSFISNPYKGTETEIDPESEADYDAGDGWIWVSKPEHIKWISKTMNTGITFLIDKKYKFKNDISLNGADHTPIGNAHARKFRGKMDGNGKSFKEAKIVASDYTGFFGSLGEDGEIKNLTIDKSVVINVDTLYVGGIAGYVPNGKVNIINCVNNANINSSSTSSITGGIVGAWHSSWGIIENCYNTGNITAAGRNVGGILGKYENPAGVPMAIKKSYNIGNITLNSTSGSSGGIAGLTFNVSDSYNIGTVKGGAFSGGIVGSTDIDDYSAPLILENVYSTTVPTVYSGNAIGGIVGNVKVTGSSLTKSYFVKGSSSVQNDGYSATSTQTGDGVNRTKTISDLATLHNEFGTTVWKTATINGITRPVLIGIGEGVGIN